MCRFYGSGLDRYYRLCYVKRGRRGQIVFWPEPREDIRVRGHVPLRRLPKTPQLLLFSKPKKGTSMKTETPTKITRADDFGVNAVNKDLPSTVRLELNVSFENCSDAVRKSTDDICEVIRKAIVHACRETGEDVKVVETFSVALDME